MTWGLARQPVWPPDPAYTGGGCPGSRPWRRCGARVRSCHDAPTGHFVLTAVAHLVTTSTRRVLSLGNGPFDHLWRASELIGGAPDSDIGPRIGHTAPRKRAQKHWARRLPRSDAQQRFLRPIPTHD